MFLSLVILNNFVCFFSLLNYWQLCVSKKRLSSAAVSGRLKAGLLEALPAAQDRISHLLKPNLLNLYPLSSNQCSGGYYFRKNLMVFTRIHFSYLSKLMLFDVINISHNSHSFFGSLSLVSGDSTSAM